MSKGGGVAKLQMPWQLNQTYQQIGQAAEEEQKIARQALDFGKQMFAYGKQRTEEFADPVLNEFLKIVGAGKGQGAGTAQFTNVLSSNLMQLPVWATQQQHDAAKKQIQQNVPPGPQQSTLLAQLDSQRMQSLGTQAYSRVDQMLNALLQERGSVWQGANAAQTGFGQALQGYGQSTQAFGQQAAIGNTAAQIAQQNQQLQLMAQQQGNQMLGGIFQTIGQLGGYALGQYAGSSGGSEAITSALGLK